MPVNFNPDLIEQAARKPKEDKPPKADPDYVAKPSGTIAGPKPKGRRAADIAAIEDGLVMSFTMLGMGLSMVNLYDAMVIQSNAELLASHWVKVAEQNPKVKKWLLAALQGGSWITAISVTGAVLVPIAVNHDAAPEELLKMSGMMGVTIPEEPKLIAGSRNGNGDSSATE